MRLFKGIQSRRPAVVGLFVAFLMGFLVHAQGATTNAENQEEASAKKSAPAAVPVLTVAEAKKANDEALKEYNVRIELLRKQRIKKILTNVFYLLIVLAVISYVAFLHKKKKLRKSLLKAYSSPAGKLFYCTRFCRLDCLGIIAVFGITFFFSMLAGEKAMRSGFIGSWYQNVGGPIALSIYNTGKTTGMVAAPESKLDDFLKKGSKGELDYSSITNEEAVPQRYTGKTSFYESTGIARLIAFWWKLIGYPDWSTLYVLFSLFYGLTAVAAYCALRQVTGLIPSIVLCLLLSSYPSMMHQVLFGFRDGARSLFCYVAIAILLYLLKGGFRWRGTIVSSVFLFVICSLSTYFRQDFIVLVPFIFFSTIIFHGKILSDYKKKIAIVLAIVIGLIVSFNLPGISTRGAMGHVLYIGMADHPYMDLLHFSADNYSKGIIYTDRYGFILAAAKAYRDRGELNVPSYSKTYNQEIEKELNELFRMYPYDFFRLALSSSIQSLQIGSRFSKRTLKWIESAPGYGAFQERSRNYYSDFPSWLYFVFFVGTILLFLGGGFYKNMFLVLALMSMSGVYALQFDIRHYFYLIIFSLLAAGFVFNRGVRLPLVLLRNWRKVWRLLAYQKKTFFIHCTVFLGVIALAFGVLLVARIVQRAQIKKQIEDFAGAKTENVQFSLKTVPSKIQKNASATDILLPNLYNDVLAREESKQRYLTEFLKVRFSVADSNDNNIVNAYAIYENTDASLPLNVGGIIYSTNTCPIRLTFNAGKEENTLYLPVYFSRTDSPLIGVQISAGGKTVEVESVERITDTNVIRTQSAFLVPNQLSEMQYAGNMDWNKVFWGEKK